jgi:hypothetical protein
MRNPVIGPGIVKLKDYKMTAKGYRIQSFYLYCEKNSIWAKTFINSETVCFTAASFLWRLILVWKHNDSLQNRMG